MTLEEVIRAANDMGLRVHNLFEREDGTWQANVRESLPDAKSDLHHQFAVQPTPTDALIAAVNLAVERRDA